VLGEKLLPLPLCLKQIWNALSCDRTRSSTVKCLRMTTWTISPPPFSAWIFSKTPRVTSYLSVNTLLPHFKSQEFKSPWRLNSFTTRVIPIGQCGHRAVSERYSRQHCSGVCAATARCLSLSQSRLLSAQQSIINQFDQQAGQLIDSMNSTIRCLCGYLGRTWGDDAANVGGALGRLLHCRAAYR